MVLCVGFVVCAALLFLARLLVSFARTLSRIFLYPYARSKIQGASAARAISQSLLSSLSRLSMDLRPVLLITKPTTYLLLLTILSGNYNNCTLYFLGGGLDLFLAVMFDLYFTIIVIDSAFIHSSQIDMIHSHVTCTCLAMVVSSSNMIQPTTCIHFVVVNEKISESDSN